MKKIKVISLSELGGVYGKQAAIKAYRARKLAGCPIVLMEMDATRFDCALLIDLIKEPSDDEQT